METQTNYRGLTEIVGLSVAAGILAVVDVVHMLHNGGAPDPTMTAGLGSIVGILIARSAKSAQDRSAIASKVDAAADTAMQIADAVRKELLAHGATNQTLLAALQSVSAVATAVQQPVPMPPPLPPPPAPPPQK